MCHCTGTRLQRCYRGFITREGKKPQVLPLFPYLFLLVLVPDWEERADTQKHIALRTWGSAPPPPEIPKPEQCFS